MIKFWTIVYKENGVSYPVYEGNDGRYYLGGSPRICKPLLFQTKLSGQETLKRVKEKEGKSSDRNWNDGTFTISRCYITT